MSDYLLLAINGLLMVLMPLIVATFLARRYGVGWGLFGAGATTFVASQILHIPFNAFVEARFLPDVTGDFSIQLVLVALFYGLSAGVFEEIARYVTFRYWRRDARSWAQSLMVGAGHGGIESLIVGLLFIVNTVVVMGIGRGNFTALVPADALPQLQAQAATILALPWYEKILGGVERVFTIVVHLALSLMVMRSARSSTPWWLLLAIAWHTLLNAAAVVTVVMTNAVITELVIGVFALISLWLIYRWREQPVEVTEIDSEPPERPLPPLEIEASAQKLDESRFL